MLSMVYGFAQQNIIFSEWGSGECEDYEDKHGSCQLRLPGSPFTINSVHKPFDFAFEY
jgi:hypothetical protein